MKECPFKYDSRNLELITELERRKKLGIKKSYPMVCNLTRYVIECIGESNCPIYHNTGGV